ncbi:NUDIX domain-containing protein [Acinetobacter sp. B51(2017)]|uniref:NUDIX domain-containing protein n=1 Tax=Acinetobacter sp. B51(2017) TaxID=2060938 RepID=UPI000F08FCAF|nr:NUDIX domain-containing protein [Acinetobacter sp. B51(2017)]
MSKAQLNVAIAILLQHGQVLVGFREADQHQGNKYEFPGGKVEAGETALEACRREVLEEVGIDIQQWQSFDFIQHEYEDLIVNLHIFHAVVPDALNNEIQQPWRWYTREQLPELNFPKANQRLIQRLVWPEYLKISADLTDLAECGAEKMLYWRNTLALEQQLSMLAEISVEHLPHLIVNIALYQALNSIQQANIGAIHLKQQQMLSLSKNDLIVGQRYIASCHDEVSLKHAEQIGCDAVLLSPVHVTATHPEAQPLGWTKFQHLAQTMHIPVFALGGLSQNDLQEAKNYAAYGIAGQRFI